MEGSRKFGEGTLLFVWNADEGWWHGLMDSLQKVLSPNTYSCKLCQLTYGIAGPKAEWSAFLDALERPVAFYHRDQFMKSPVASEVPNLELPAVLLHTSDSWNIHVCRREIMALKDLEGLMALLKKRDPGSV